ncbi:MAG TPA: squalene synthase HpnC [Paenalcaligenes sp.]|nr:squalene synthase HpnC [Paenalcaligenes sp.]
MPVDHYENFPVASILLPKRLRLPVQHIYRFARCADDVADEGEHSDQWRLDELALYAQQLDLIQQQRLKQDGLSRLRPIFGPLAEVITAYDLPLKPFHDLLSAFQQDVHTKRYQDYTDLLNYCTRSADPVGRILLHLYEENRPDSLTMSDAVCTGLQLTNFWQDVAIDWHKDRVYIPQQELQRFNVNESDIAQAVAGQSFNSAQQQAWRALMQAQVSRARELLNAGKPLCRRLPGRINLELRLIIQGGLRILEKLERVQFDVFTQRPIIKKQDSLLLFVRALRN